MWNHPHQIFYSHVQIFKGLRYAFVDDPRVDEKTAIVADRGLGGETSLMRRSEAIFEL